MGFLIPLGIKINFLFCPWSAWSWRGWSYQLGKKSADSGTLPSTKPKLTYGNWLLLHLPSRSHLHRHISWQREDRSQITVCSGCQMVLLRRRQGNEEPRYVCQHVTSEPGWACTIVNEGTVQRGERGEAENSVTWDPTASDYPLLISVTPVSNSWCPNTAGLKTH